MPEQTKTPVKVYLGLHISILVFSLAGIFSKLAAQHPTLSWPFIFFYGVNLFICFAYAIVWQQFLKKIPLNTAYSNRILTMVWSMLWGALFFHEPITLTMVIGAAIILFGLRMVVTADE